MPKINKMELERFIWTVKKDLRTKGISTSDNRPFSDIELKIVKQVIDQKLKENR